MVWSSIKPLIGGWRMPDSIIGPLDSFPDAFRSRFIPMINKMGEILGEKMGEDNRLQFPFPGLATKL